MTQAVGDRWAAGAAYDRYMGRWSVPLARAFLAWLAPARGGDWLDVGCGTGALTSSVCALCAPRTIVACDPSSPFLEYAQSRVADPRVSYVQVAADALPDRDAGFDVVASGLVLNFTPEPERALRTMCERARPGGTVAAYVWDYAGGLEFLRHFWEEAVTLDPGALELDEARRFGRWQPPMLDALFRGAGLQAVETAALEISTRFHDFADYWEPFLGATGPAPSYVASLDPARREQLRTRLEQRLSARDGESIRLRARATAARGIAR